jgi:transposase
VAREVLVNENLWQAMLLWLLPERRDVRGGPPRVSNRAALAGIIFVLRHGLRWRDLPQELGYGSGVTCWRRPRRWQALGVSAGVHRTLLNWLGDLRAIDWTRASVDSTSVRAKRGGEATRPNPTDRGKQGSKYHLLVDRQGTPLAGQLSAANVHDSRLLDRWSMPSRRFDGPSASRADRGLARPSCTETRDMTILPAARRCGDAGSRRASPAAVSSRARGWTNTWVLAYRRLATRFDRQAASVSAFLHLACALICVRFLRWAEPD